MHQIIQILQLKSWFHLELLETEAGYLSLGQVYPKFTLYPKWQKSWFDLRSNKVPPNIVPRALEHFIICYSAPIVASQLVCPASELIKLVKK